MNKNQIDNLMNALLSISALLILVGSLLKLQHAHYGELILWIGIIASLGVSYFEISRLKKIIKILRKKTLITDLE
jgi:hypothetical protein